MVVVAHIIKQVIIDADGVVAEVPAGSLTSYQSTMVSHSLGRLGQSRPNMFPPHGPFILTVLNDISKKK